jgi:hypothetical protein
MTMGPWIQVLSIVAVDQTDMNQGFSLAEEVLPWITNMAGGRWGRAGARWRRAVPRWHRSALAYGPVAPYHIHLLHMSMFVTILVYFCYISCIQIIL